MLRDYRGRPLDYWSPRINESPICTTVATWVARVTGNNVLRKGGRKSPRGILISSDGQPRNAKALQTLLLLQPTILRAKPSHLLTSRSTTLSTNRRPMRQLDQTRRFAILHLANPGHSSRFGPSGVTTSCTRINVPLTRTQSNTTRLPRMVCDLFCITMVLCLFQWQVTFECLND